MMKRRLLIAIFILIVCMLSACANGDAKLPSDTNGDFEIISNGFPNGWHRKIYNEDYAIVELAEDSQRYNVVHINNLEDNDSRACIELDVSPNKGYKLSCYIKTKGVAGGAGANIGVYGVAISSEGLYGDNDWTYVELVGRTAKDQDKLVVSVGIGGHGSLAVGEAWFDCFDIEFSNEGDNSNVLFGKVSEVQADSDSDVKYPTGMILTASILLSVALCLVYVFYSRLARKSVSVIDQTKTNAKLKVALILTAALIIRVIVSILITGHKTDINCFTSWGNKVATGGPATLYESWCDYPPGYMLVLGLMSSISKFFGFSVYLPDGGYDTAYVILMKLPCMLADLACAYIVYRIAKEKMNSNAALLLMSLVAFSPIMIFISSGWGQIDQMLTLFLLVPILLLYMRMPITAGLVYGFAIIMKPQALMAGPLFAAVYAMYVFAGTSYREFSDRRGLPKLFKIKKDSIGIRLMECVFAVMAAVAVIVVISIPFTGSQKWYWILEKYYNTATSYEYATVNAYNFWALIGANWASIDIPFLGLTYGKWGTVFMVLAVISSVALYVFDAVKHKLSKGALPMLMAFLFAMIFTFGHYMHERYLFPALMLIMLAYVLYNDRRLIWTYLAYSATLLLNCAAAFFYSELFDFYRETGDRSLLWNENIIFWCSLLNIAVFAWFSYVTIDLIIRNKPAKSYARLENKLNEL